MRRRQFLRGEWSGGIVDAIAPQGRPTAVHQESVPVRTVPAEKGEKHVFVIAAEKHALRPFVLQLDEALDDRLGRGTAVDVVAETDDRIVRSRRDGIEEAAELVGAAVQVA